MIPTRSVLLSVAPIFAVVGLGHSIRGSQLIQGLAVIGGAQGAAAASARLSSKGAEMAMKRAEQTQVTQGAQRPAEPLPVDLKASDGTVLKATYFAAAKPGPGLLLLHQSNRTRDSWDGVARQIAAAGINTLTLDMRGFGESGGPYTKLTDPEKAKVSPKWPSDVDTAFQYLVSRPGVNRDAIGVGGAGWFGVLHAIEVARQHSAEVKSLVLLSGETLQDGLQFLRQASQLPGLFVVADDDEYPPTVEAMEWLYINSSSPGKKFVHYSAAQDAPWIWYETSDASKVAAKGGHGTDMFKPHPELPGIIVDWLVTTLIKTPGHAPADAIACAAILNQLWTPEGVARAKRQLMEARRSDPQARLWPEVNVDIIGEDHVREGESKRKAGQLREAKTEMDAAIEIFKLNLLAYPDSADAHYNLADAYLKDGQKDLARQNAEKALAMIDSHKAPLSSWSDTEQRRGEIRDGVEDVLKKLNTSAAATSSRAPDTTATSAPQEQQAAPTQTAPTVASVVDREISAIEKQVIDVTEAMPEDKFNFSPESLNLPGGEYKGVRSFAGQVKHIAASNYFIWSPITGDKVPENIKDGNGPADLKSKADIIKFLKDSFALGHKAAATLTVENMLQNPGSSKSTRLRLATFGVAHAYDHYGQMIEYLRMNGIVPPASR
jgi:tetratricopeptide (TPR) repeat protein